MASEEDPGREAWLLLFQLFRSQRHQFMAIQAESGLNMAHIHLLKALEKPEGSPMSELAEAVMCDASYITGLVDKLEDKGLVQRLTNPEDRRVKLIALTPSGAEARSKVTERLSVPPLFIEALAVEDKRALRDIFMRASEMVADAPSKA
jgi:DNA-binding MarR family transcriptional regulator